MFLLDFANSPLLKRGEHHQWFSFPDRTSNDQILHRGELEHVQMQLHLGFLQEERNRIMESFRYIFPIFGDNFFW